MTAEIKRTYLAGSPDARSDAGVPEDRFAIATANGLAVASVRKTDNMRADSPLRVYGIARKPATQAFLIFNF